MRHLLQQQQPRTVLSEMATWWRNAFCFLLWGVYSRERRWGELNILQQFWWFMAHLLICCGSVTFSPPPSSSYSPDCYLAFSRSRGESGPNRKQPRVAHVCALRSWREIKGMWQAPCLIYTIICNISMSQTAPAKQHLMIQTHKTHTGWGLEVKTAQQRRQILPGALLMDSPPRAEAAGKTFCFFLPDPSVHLPGGCYVTACKIVFQHICQQRSLTDELLSNTQPQSFCASTAFWNGIIYHNPIVFCQLI